MLCSDFYNQTALLYTMDTGTTPNKKQPAYGFPRSLLYGGAGSLLGVCLVGMGMMVGWWLHSRVRSPSVFSRESSQQPMPTTNHPLRDVKAECALQIEVLDIMHRPVKGAELVLVEAKPDLLPAGSLLPVGELGVWKGPLPTPREVIAQPSLSMNSSVARKFQPVRTDGSGYARWFGVPKGFYHLTGNLGVQAGQLWMRWQPKEGPCDPAPQQLVLVLQSGSLGMGSGEAMGAGVTNPLLGDNLQSVSVEVTDRQNHPVGAAVVQGQVGEQSFLCATNPQGRCLLNKVPKQELTLTVRTGSRTSWSRVFPASEWTVTDLLRITLGGENGVEGRVRDSRLGNVRSRVTLSLRTPEGEVQLPVDTNGHFAVEGIAAGPATFRVQAPGYLTLQERIQIPTNGWVRGVLLELKRSGTVEGRVRSVSSAELGGVKVQALSQEGTLLGQSSVDRRGEYRIEGIPPGDIWVVCGEARVQVQIYPDHVQRASELEVK